MTRQTKAHDSASSTKEKLLEAATDIFGRHGYDAATTRMIAGEAGVNIAAIPYHYKGKEGLYRAVVHHIINMAEAGLMDSLQEIASNSFTGPNGVKEARALLEKLLEKYISFIIGSSQAPRVSRIILREQMYPTPAYDIIFTGFMAKGLNMIAKLLVIISGNPSERIAKLRSMTLIGQILAFRVARESAVRALDMEGYSPEETEEIRQIIIENTRAIIDGFTHSSHHSG